MNESLASGKVGILYAPSHAGSYPLQLVRDNNPGAEWKSFPVLSIDGSPAKAQANSGVGRYWVVKKGYKHPEAIFKMLDFWIKTFYENKTDEIEEKYVSSKDGNSFWLLNEIAIYRAFRNVDAHKHIVEVLDGKMKVDELTPGERGFYNKVVSFVKDGDERFWGFNAVFGKDGGRGIVIKYVEGDLFQENEFFGAPTATMTDKGATLQAMTDETFAKIITGSETIDAFDMYVEDWEKSGGEKITQEVNDWYQTVK